MKTNFLVSTTPSQTNLATSIILIQKGIQAQAAHLRHQEFQMGGATSLGLSSLNIHETNHESILLDHHHFKHHIIALDESTRNLIQAEYKKLVPLYCEVAENKTVSFEEKDIINTIHHVNETAENFKENVRLFFE